MKIQLLKTIILVLLGSALISSCGSASHTTVTQHDRTETFTDFDNGKTVELFLRVENENEISNEKPLEFILGRTVRGEICTKEILKENTVRSKDPDLFMGALGLALTPVAIVVGDGGSHVGHVGDDLFGSNDVVGSKEKDGAIKNTGRFEEKFDDTVRTGSLNVFINGAPAQSSEIHYNSVVRFNVDELFNNIEFSSSPFTIKATLFSGGLNKTIEAQGKISVDGGVYEGPLLHGRPNGRGQLTWPDGRKFAGYFDKGKMLRQGAEVDDPLQN